MITIGTVSFLNALPLVHGLDQQPGVRLVRNVPAALLTDLETAKLDIALCPVIDAQTSSREVLVVPSGAIGSKAQTLTVRVFSKVPLTEIHRLHVDGDSHTSVALAQVIFHHRYQRSPRVLPLHDPTGFASRTDLQAALLIGDKVVTAEPNAGDFPYQMDLGQAWRDLTGLPFVFATWLAPPEIELGRLPQLLSATRRANCNNLHNLVGTWARKHGWPMATALSYLRDLLDFEIGPTQIKAMRLFWKECADLGLIEGLKAIDTLEV